MAMYYYASKISAIACGTRCKQSILQKSRGQRDRDKREEIFTKMKEDDERLEITNYGHEVSSPIKLKLLEGNNFNGTTGSSKYEKKSISLSNKDISIEGSALGTGGIMYASGKIISGPIESLVNILLPRTSDELDKEFAFSFLLSSRLFIRPHELLGKLLSFVSENESLEPLVGLLSIWTRRFPYDFRDERMMSHVKHIVSRCSNTGLEEIVSELLSALLNRLTDLEKHEADLRACQINTDKTDSIQCPTSTQLAQILCRIERKLAKHIGPEEFLQCSTNILLDKQSKKCDLPSTSSGPPGIQDPKKTCNLETYLEWSARLRLFVCNEILQCNGIRDRSKVVELWSGVAQYCLLVGNYNSATAILESLESPAIARLKITWSKLSTTCQQLDCMQRHAEGCGDLWSKQTIVLNETTADKRNPAILTSASVSTINNSIGSCNNIIAGSVPTVPVVYSNVPTTANGSTSTGSIAGSSICGGGSTEGHTIVTPGGGDSHSNRNSNLSGGGISNSTDSTTTASNSCLPSSSGGGVIAGTGKTTVAVMNHSSGSGHANPKRKPNDWVVIPVFADIVKLALTAREDCLRRLPNGHVNTAAFNRLAAIVGAFTKHMSQVKMSAPDNGEYENFCRHMQKLTTLTESDLMMASFDCEEPTNAEKLMYDLS